MNKIYKIQLLVSAIVLVISLMLAISNPALLIDISNYDIFFFKTYHVVWLVVMLEVVASLFPQFDSNMAGGKKFARNYSETTIKISSKKEKLKRYTRKMNIGAVKVAILWSVVLSIIGISYYSNIINEIGTFIIVIFFYFLDKLFVCVWCPFRNWLIKNKCCNTCRIYSWGTIMMFCPLVFIPSFWTYSILLVSIIAVLQWEYLHYKHPERFYELYNANLMCKNCKTKCKRNPKIKS